jgi:acyl-CoA thioesterase YciA
MIRFINRQFIKGHQRVLNQSQRGIISHKRHRDVYGVRVDNNQIEPTLRSIAMQKHITPNGAISGGWLMSQMDLAGGVIAWDITNGPIYTVACDSLQFHKPVMTGSLVSFYANLIETNNTSLKVFIEGKVRQPPSKKNIRVITGTFTYVAIDQNNKPRKVSISNNEQMDVATSERIASVSMASHVLKQRALDLARRRGLPRKLTTDVVLEP